MPEYQNNVVSSSDQSENTNNKLETQSAENSAIKTIDERVRINIHK